VREREGEREGERERERGRERDNSSLMKEIRYDLSFEKSLIRDNLFEIGLKKNK
jgi:hypothetical protein